jgi:hypothetical protein
MSTVNLSLSEVHHTTVSVFAGEAVDVNTLGFSAVLATAVILMLVSFALEAIFRVARKVFAAIVVAALIGLPITGIWLMSTGR